MARKYCYNYSIVFRVSLLTIRVIVVKRMPSLSKTLWQKRFNILLFTISHFIIDIFFTGHHSL